MRLKPSACFFVSHIVASLRLTESAQVFQPPTAEFKPSPIGNAVQLGRLRSAPPHYDAGSAITVAEDPLHSVEPAFGPPLWKGFIELWSSVRLSHVDAPVTTSREELYRWMTHKLEEKVLILAVFICVVPPITAIVLSYLLPPRITGARPRVYEYLLGARENAAFATDLEISVRGTMGILVLAIPFMTPFFSPLLDAGYYTSTAAMLFVFTLYKTVGETVNYAFEGILGTFFAVFNIWMMQGFFPGGVSSWSDPLVWWFGVIEGSLFICLVLMMDLDKSCQMFALNWHCYFWMDFLNPSNRGTYSEGFQVDAAGPAISALVQSCFGVGIAVCAVLLPFPLFALNKARDMSIKLADELAEAWDAALICFVPAARDIESESRFDYDVSSLTANVGRMAGYADSAWWECLGLPGRPQRVRDFLCQLAHTVSSSHSRLCGLRHLCRVAPRGPAHSKLMQELHPYLANLSKQTGELMKTLAACAIDGLLDESEKASIQAKSAQVTDAMTQLSKEYSQRKAEEDLFHEAMWCLTYCSYARMTQDFEKALVFDLSSGSLTLQNFRAWLARFKLGLTDPMTRNCCLRSSTAILLCFAIGYSGYSSLLPRYNAVPAATVSLLLSSGFGAEATKNLVRFEGVVLGVVFGQLAYSFFGWCTVLSYIGVGVFLVLWTLPTFIMYYHSTAYSLLGCLLAAFGVVGVLRGCTNKTFETSGSYTAVVSIVVAITIKIIVDSCLARGRASEEAIKALVSAWEQLRVAMAAFFDPDAQEIHFKNEVIREAFRCAANLSQDARKEPRLWWSPWKHELFAKVCTAGFQICKGLSNLEATFSKTGRDRGQKSATLTTLENIPEFRAMANDILAQIKAMEKLSFEAFSFNRDGLFSRTYTPPEGSIDVEALRCQVKQVTSSLSKNVGPWSARIPKYSPRHAMTAADSDTLKELVQVDNLEDDVHCKMGVFYSVADWLIEIMEVLEEDILST